jgi:hypothetical protein
MDSAGYLSNFLARFQYGDLHFGQTRGSSPGSGGFFPSGISGSPRGTHS